MNSSRSRTPVIRAIAILAIVAALATGCGSDSKSKDKAKDKDNQTTAKKADSSSTTSKGSTSPTSAGGSTATSSAKPGGGGDFCSKISDQEASDVLGVPIERRESPPNSPKGVGSCVKGTLRQSDLTKVAYVSFSAFPAAGPFASFDKVKGQFKDAKVLDGLGDQALFTPSVGAVFAFAGGKAYSVQVVKGGRPAGEADVIAMAKALLGRV